MNRFKTVKQFRQFFFPDDTKLKIETVTKAEQEDGRVKIHREFYTFRALVSHIWFGLIRQDHLKNETFDWGSVYWMYHPERGAIAIDTATSGTDDSSASSITVSHTSSGSNRVAVGFVATNDPSTNMTTATYDGVSMTAVTNKDTPTAGFGIKCYRIVAPNTGSKNVVFNMSSTNRHRATVVSFTGADQVTGVEANNSANGTSGTASVSVTTLTDGAIVIDGVNVAANVTITANGSQAEQSNVGGSSPKHGSSTKTQASAGSCTMSWTFTSNEWASIAVSVKPGVVNLDISVSDTSTITESSTLDVKLQPNVNDAVTVTESVALSVRNNISVNDAVTISESVTASIPTVGNISVNDSVSITESISGFLRLGDISVSDAVTISESSAASFVYQLSVSDAITVTESVNLSFVLNAVVNDTITVSETKTLTLYNNISVNDSVTITESATLLPLFNNDFTDNPLAINAGNAATTPLGTDEQTYGVLPSSRGYN